MILNAYAVLAIFVGVVELILGIVLVSVGFAAIRRRRRALASNGSGGGGGAATAATESRMPLLFLLSAALLGVSVVSWPLLYLLLGSYVPEWPGVMCIQGVTRIGTGSLGAAGWLPTLVSALEFTKPALVFATGTWLVLHLANRRTRTAPLTGRVLAVLLASGLLAAADAAAQLAYVGIPKKEHFLARGCCTAVPQVADRGGAIGDLFGAAPRDTPHVWLPAAFWGLSVAMAVGTWWSARRRADPAKWAPRPGWRPAPLMLGALLCLPIGVAFLSDVAAPAFLRLPGHHCCYCLLPDAPVAVAGIGLYLIGVFGTGWASLLRWFAAGEETRPFLTGQVNGLLHAGLFGYLGALLLTSVELAIT